MTDGDGDRSDVPPGPAAEPGREAADVAALCRDSDDLLTTRRGFVALPPATPLANGHTVVSEESETTFLAGPPLVEAPESAALDAIMADEHEAFELTPAQRAPTPMVDDLVPEGHAVPPPAEARSDEQPPDDGLDATVQSPPAPHPSEAPASVAQSVQEMPPAEPFATVVAEPIEDASPIPIQDGSPIPAERSMESAPPAESSPSPAPVGVSGVPIEHDDAMETAPDGLALGERTNGIAVYEATTTEYRPEYDSAAESAATALEPNGVAAVGAVASTEEVAPLVAAVEAPLVEEPPYASVPSEVAAGAQILAGPLTVDDNIPAVPPTEPPAPPEAVPPPATPPPGDEEEEGASMTIIEHLEELRQRITKATISIVVGAVLGWFITPHVVQYLEESAKKLDSSFFSPTILGPFALELKLSFVIGVILASPVVLYQIWAFVAPGLTRRERRYALPFSLVGGGLFAIGSVVGVLVVPLAIRFLATFFSVLGLEKLLDIDKYIMFIVLIAVIFGITFELPIFMVGFSLLGIVNSRFFIQKFRIAIFVIYGAAMVITPGADLVSPLVLGTFLIVLYWLGVFLIRAIGR